MDHVWTCRCCGKRYNTLPLGYAPTAPAELLQKQASLVSLALTSISGADFGEKMSLLLSIAEHFDTRPGRLYSFVGHKTAAS